MFIEVQSRIIICYKFTTCRNFLHLKLNIQKCNIRMKQASICHYFTLGGLQKTSLSIQYCRENDFIFLKNPTPEQVISAKKNTIIEGTIDLFSSLEQACRELRVIYFGSDFSNKQQQTIRKQYSQIGKCVNIPRLDYSSFRRQMYSNMIFVFGPVADQNEKVSMKIANTIGYAHEILSKDPNHLIENIDKTKNYVVNGLFMNIADIKILEQYFNLRVVHLKYEKEDLPKHDHYFNEEYDLLPYLQAQNYYIAVPGASSHGEILSKIGEGVCPQLIYVNYDKNEHGNYIDEYLIKTDGVMLNLQEIEGILNRKGIQSSPDSDHKIAQLTELLYKDFNRKQLLISQFPAKTEQFIKLENLNKKFSFFVDLQNMSHYEFTNQYSSAIYFLENQRRISPKLDLELENQLANKQIYWIVNGPGTCGKTTAAKYISNEFGFKLIEFQAQVAAVKQKLASPEDGDQVPVKKYIAYFAQMISKNPNTVYVFDSLPYENENLQAWISKVGCPDVINLKVSETEQIKRTRKKAEGDLLAEVTEEETAKASENKQKNQAWVQKLGQLAPSSRIYQVDYNIPLILAEPLINSILRPRIFLVQKNNHLVYQNIALNQNMGFVNLTKQSLKESLPFVKSCNKRDIILCNYSQQEEKLISEEMYWIQKNLGEIRYLGIWEPEQKEINEKLMELERPPVVEKVKPAQGEQEGEKQEQAAEDEDGPPKKKFDIYEYQWTQPTSHKNLSQWFFKLKKKVQERTTTPEQCFDKFGEVLQQLNQHREVNIYETIS